MWECGEINRKKVPRLEEVLAMFDGVLAQQGTTFVAGDKLSVADLSMYFHWILFKLTPEIDTSVYHAIRGWSLKVEDALKPVNTDGFFDKAFDSLKEYTELIVRGIEQF